MKGIVLPQSITLNQTEAKLAKGATLVLTATVKPEDADDRSVTWSSSNSGVATVDAGGKVTAVSTGTAIITATTSNGLKGTCTVTVTDGSGTPNPGEPGTPGNPGTPGKPGNPDDSQNPGKNDPVMLPANIQLEKTVYYYDGKAKKPVVTIAGLKEGTDYTVSYSKNIQIGTALVTVTGRGKYTGVRTATFAITVKKGAKYTVGSLKYKVTGTAVNGKGTVSVSAPKSKKITKVTIPESVKIGGVKFLVTSIDNKAFRNCKKLKTVTFKGKKLKTIGSSAFQSCTALTKIQITAGVTKIGSQAFSGCKKLKSLVVKSTKLKSVGSKALKGIDSKAKIKVPAKKLNAYKKLFKGKGQGKKVKITK